MSKQSIDSTRVSEALRALDSSKKIADLNKLADVTPNAIDPDPVIARRDSVIATGTGGTYGSGGIFYSETMPQGTGEGPEGFIDQHGKPLKFDEKMWNRMKFALRHNVKTEELDDITNFLEGIGYLDKGDPRNFDHLYKDRAWQGAIKRYQFNFSDDTIPYPGEDALKAVKDWWRHEDRMWNK